jgi:hypothetical protein
MAKEVCELTMKKISKAITRKAEKDNLIQLFKRFPLFASRPQVL